MDGFSLFGFCTKDFSQQSLVEVIPSKFQRSLNLPPIHDKMLFRLSSFCLLVSNKNDLIDGFTEIILPLEIIQQFGYFFIGINGFQSLQFCLCTITKFFLFLFGNFRFGHSLSSLFYPFFLAGQYQYECCHGKQCGSHCRNYNRPVSGFGVAFVVAAGSFRKCHRQDTIQVQFLHSQFSVFKT